MTALKDDHHLRADCRLASRLLSLGVVSDEKAEELYRLAMEGAQQAAAAGNWRNYNACMRTLQAGSKLEIEYLKTFQPQKIQVEGDLSTTERVIIELPDNQREPGRLTEASGNGNH